MKKLLPLFLFVTICSVHAQVFFQKLYGEISPAGISANGIFPAADGGYMVSGTTGLAFTYAHPGFMSFDSSGNIRWSKFYNTGLAFESLSSAIQTRDSGCLMIGYRSANTREIYLIKTDGAGNVQWAKSYTGADDIYEELVGQTVDGGYIISGNVEPNGILTGDLLIKIDSSGNVQWNRLYEGINGNGALQTADGGYVLSGIYDTSGYAMNTMLKTDSTGMPLWHKTFNFIAPFSFKYTLISTSDQGLILATHTNSFGAGGADIVLIKMDSNGNILWSNAYGGANNDYPSSVKEFPGGGYFIAGSTNSFGSTKDAYLLRIDFSGNLLWSKIYGDDSHDEEFYGCNILLPTADSGFIMAATSDTIGDNFGKFNIYMVKADSTGFSGCHEESSATIETPITLIDTNISLFVDSVNLSVSPLVMTIVSAGAGRTICESIGIEEREKGDRMILYPNPTEGKITIDIGLSATKNIIDAINIYNVMGKPVGIFSKTSGLTGEAEIHIDISNLPSGIYFVQATLNEKLFWGKVVKE